MLNTLLAQIVPQVSGVLAFLGSIGAGTWVFLVVADTGIGLIVRSGNGGIFSWDYIKSFLKTNFATKEAVVMYGLVGSAGVNAAAAVLVGGNTGLHAMFLSFLSASAAAFTAGAAAQDLALLKDIVGKLSGQSAGQLARKLAVNRLRA